MSGDIVQDLYEAMQDPEDPSSVEKIGQALEREFKVSVENGLEDTRENRTKYYVTIMQMLHPEAFADPWVALNIEKALLTLCEELGEEAAALMIQQTISAVLQRVSREV